MNRRNLTKLILLFPFISIVASYARRTRGKIKFKGNVLINGKQIKKNQSVQVNDTIQTVGENSYIEFALKQDAFKISNDAIITLGGHKKVSDIDVKKGRLLAVFKTGRNRTIKTLNATMGIRGTGVYINATKDKTNFCTCYGKTTLYENDHKHEGIELQATHHNPVVIENGKISKMGMAGHEDDELRILEAMVGRKPAFDR